MRNSPFGALCAAALAFIGVATLATPTFAQQSSVEPWRQRNLSFTGSYLSALAPERDQETDAAAGFLSRALARDPNDPILITQTFTSRMMNGDVAGALPLARRLLQLGQPSRFVLMSLVLDAMSTGDFDAAEELIAREITDNPIAEVTSNLILAWIRAGRGDTDAAIETIWDLTGPPWYLVFANYQSGLIEGLGGNLDEAASYLQRVYDADPSGMRMTEAYIAMLANAGQVDLAKKMLVNEIAVAPHPILERLNDTLGAGETPPLPVTSAVEGAAEVLYTLGSAIGVDAPELATVYLTFALFADPDNEYATFALAELMQNLRRYERSAETFATIERGSPFFASAQVRRALSLDALDETELAVSELQDLLAADPTDVTASLTLADILSGHERFGEATGYYTNAIDLIERPEPGNWVLYYRRGITYERTNQWPLAEDDFFRALELSPDRPEVLNYLGYTWADRGENLERALGMIQKAVDLRPNDGYIVDSLGWAYYMLGDYEEAVVHLERAVSLSPSDSILNDHLGDAYWMVGRTREAVFQWTHARDLGAEGDALALITDKIANGLPIEPAGEEKSGLSDTAALATDSEVETAKAKINLALHVLGRRDDGFHDLDTLVVFAETGDRLAMVPGSAPGIELAVSGEFARDLPRSGSDNLVSKAVGAFFAATDEPIPPLRFDLAKNLPTAAGIGGGSADAAACLRILRRAFPGRLARAALMACAGSLGADVPMCLDLKTLRAQGRGERVEMIPGFPPISLVLAKPRAKLDRRTVFEGLRLPEPMPLPPLSSIKSAADLVPWLSATRNDLQPRAKELVPEIADVLDALCNDRGSLFARMSGSGPTCFALFGDAMRSREAAQALRGRFPDWWIVATTASARDRAPSREPTGDPL